MDGTGSFDTRTFLRTGFATFKSGQLTFDQRLNIRTVQFIRFRVIGEHKQNRKLTGTQHGRLRFVYWFLCVT